MLGFTCDQIQETPKHSDRRHEQPAVVLSGSAGGAHQFVEHVVQIFREILVRREKSQIGIQFGSSGIVVARTYVNVAPDPALLAPDDQRGLSMRLQLDQAGNHVDARLFQPPRPSYVPLLVESGFELHENIYRFTRRGSSNQCVHDRRSPTSSV